MRRPGLIGCGPSRGFSFLVAETGPVNGSLALVVALAAERRAVQRCLPALRRQPWEDGWIWVGDCHGQQLGVLQAGIGRLRARSALLGVARRLSVSGAWSLGFAGGLHEDLRAGDLMCPEAVLHEAKGETQCSPPPPGCQVVRAALAAEGLPVHGGGLLTVDVPLRTPEAKRLAQRRTGALAVDMEAEGVADAAGQLGIPWLALKAVVDSAAEPLPEFLERLSTVEGNLRWARVLGGLVAAERRRVLRGVGRAAARAAASLRRGLPVAIRAWTALTPTQLSG